MIKGKNAHYYYMYVPKAVKAVSCITATRYASARSKKIL